MHLRLALLCTIAALSIVGRASAQDRAEAAIASPSIPAALAPPASSVPHAAVEPRSSGELVETAPGRPVPQCREGAWWRASACMREERRWEWGPSGEVLLGGLALFAISYGIQALSTAVSYGQGEHDVGPGYPRERLDDYSRWGFVPLLGPWAKLALAPPHVDLAGETLFFAEGILELVGLVAIVVSLFVHEEVEWVPDSALSWRVRPDGLALSF